MTLKNNRAPLLGYIKLCALFQSHQWIQTGVTILKHSVQVKIGFFFVPCGLESWWMTLKTIGHLFYATASFVHHFIAIDQFKLELQSGNAQFLVKMGNFLSYVTLKFDGWPWKTIGQWWPNSLMYICIIQYKLDKSMARWYLKSPWSLSHRPLHLPFKVMAKVKPDGHSCGVEFNWYVCF